MKRQLFNIFVIIFIGAINIKGSCSGDVGSPAPACTWDDKGEIGFNSVKLYPPTSQNYYGFTQDFPMQSLSEIFSRPINRPTKSTIEVATIVTNCIGTLSQSKKYTETNMVGVGVTQFKNLKRVSNIAQSSHSVTIIMVSGPYTSMTDPTEIGTIIWTKKIDTNPYDRLQPALNMVGVFKSDRAKVINVYVNDKFRTLEML